MFEFSFSIIRQCKQKQKLNNEKVSERGATPPPSVTVMTFTHDLVLTFHPTHVNSMIIFSCLESRR